MLQRRLIALCTGLLVFLTGFTQVKLQTGSATFSLPMFNWQDNRSRLNVGVALSYSSGSGLKTSDVASSVGQGWNLFAGGVITRLQVGEPDDQQAYGAADEHDITKYPDGLLHTTRDPIDGCPLALTRYPIYGAKNERYKQHNAVAADKQLDYFSFQFNGKGGMFVLDRNEIGKCVSLGHTKMIITFDQANMTGDSIRTTITSFTIQDDDGLIYRFKKHGVTKVLETKFCDKSLTQSAAQPNFKPGGIYFQAGFVNPDYVNPYIIGSWYLSEIEDPLTHRKITLSYETRTIDNVAGADISWDEWHDYIIISHKRSVTKSPVISSIVCPDGHKVNFKYEKNRVDLQGDKALTAIDVSYTTKNRFNIDETRYLSRHLINTSYFILNRYGTPTSTYQRKMARLCLRSVKKLGPDLKEDSPPYTFDYYMGSNSIEDFVPPPFCVTHDIWGFYNGFNSVGYNKVNNNDELILPTSDVSNLNFNQLKGLCFLHNGVPISDVYLNPKAGYAKNGLLKQIIYPTGGSLSYQYAQNTGVLNVDGIGSSTMVGGIHVSATSSADGGYSNGCGNPIVTHYSYVTDAGQSSLWGLELPDNTTEMTMHYSPEKRNYRWSWRKCGGGLYGCCYYAYTNPGILSQVQNLSLTDLQKFFVNNEAVLGVISGVMTVVNIAVIALGSTGVLSIVALAIDVISSWIQLGVTCLRDNSKDGTTITHHSYDFNGVSPLPAQFKRVEVVEGLGANGRTVHVFTSADDYPIWVKQNPGFTLQQRFASWAYGLPRFTTIKDAQGNKIKETEYRYNWYKYVSGANRLLSCQCVVKKNSSQRYTDWVQPVKYNADYQTSSVPGVLDVQFYQMYVGRSELWRTLERTYKKGDNSKYVETKTDYNYNSGYPNYELGSMVSFQSDGSWTTKYIKYSGQYSSGLLGVLRNNNIVSVPVLTEEGLSGPDAGGYLHGNVVEFTRLSNGDIKPLRTLEQRSDRPKSSWGIYNGPGNTDYNYWKVTQFFRYDASGNLTNAKDEGGRSVANIYDYNDKYVVASIINSDTLDNPAYTSFETKSLGGWQLSATATYVDNNAITGASVLNLAGNSCSATLLNTAKSYTLSFWANNNNVAVSGGATLLKSAPVINGFTYYEYLISAGAGNVTLTGNALIDELRIYPSAARMRTVTYDPLIGKTSECDENNRVIYYEYDNLARIQFVKDENRNVVKMYEYNNVSKQSGCPQIYYNQDVTEYFTKSNCVGDYIGSDEPTTIPANKYSSTISQEHADAQAQAELLTKGQQNADLNGSCIRIYYNTEHWQDFETETCDDGHYGGTVRYTVPARRYWSKVPGEADQMALDDIAANGQVNANDPDHAICLVDTDPSYIWQEGAPTDCRQVNGEWHMFGQAIDVNPNSSSYNQPGWLDMGPSGDCQFVDIIPNINTFMSFNATFTNVYTNQSYHFALSPSSNGNVIGQIPQGTYNVTITPTGGVVLYEWWVGAAYQAGTNSFNMYDLYMRNGDISISEY